MYRQELEHRDLENQPTGTHGEAEFRVVIYPFDRYLVHVKVGPENEFLGIIEITLNRDFLSTAQRIASIKALGYHDVDEFYREPGEE